MKELAAFNVLCAIIAAKWMSDLEQPQLRQLFIGLVALFLGPLVLLVLYVYVLYRARKLGRPAAKWF